MPARTQSTLRSTPPQPRSLTRQFVVALRDWPVMLAEAGLAVALIVLMLIQCFVNAPLPESTADAAPLTSGSSRRDAMRSDPATRLLCGPGFFEEGTPDDGCWPANQPGPQITGPSPNLHSAQVLGV